MAAGIVITNIGEGWACQRMAGVQGADTTDYHTNAGAYIYWGTGTTTPVKADTGLQTPSSDPAARVATTVTVTGNLGTAKYSASATVPSTSSQAITEAGLFASSTIATADCFIHAVFAAINVVSGDSVAFTFTIDPS